MNLYVVSKLGKVRQFDPAKDTQAEIESLYKGIVVFAQDEKEALTKAREYGIVGDQIKEFTSAPKQYLFNLKDSSFEEYTPNQFPEQRKKLASGKSIVVLARNSGEVKSAAKELMANESSPNYFKEPVIEKQFYVTPDGSVYDSKKDCGWPYVVIDADYPEEALEYARRIGYLDKKEDLKEDGGRANYGNYGKATSEYKDYLVLKNGRVVEYKDSPKQKLDISRGRAMVFSGYDEDDVFDEAIHSGFLSDTLGESMEDDQVESSVDKIKRLSERGFDSDEFLNLPSIAHVIEDCELDTESTDWITGNTKAFLDDLVDVYSDEPEVLENVANDLESISEDDDSADE